MTVDQIWSDDAVQTLTSNRWFGDKSRAIAEVRTVANESVDIGGQRFHLTVCRVRFEHGDPAFYFLAHDATGNDAVSQPAFLRWWMSGFGESRQIQGASTWSWQSSSADVMDFEQARQISAEQSNTTVILDQRLIAKFFRRLQPGENPDLEIGRFLTEIGTFHHIPSLYGSVEVEFAETSWSICAIQEFVPNVSDGWTWLLNELRSGESGYSRVLDGVRVLARRTAEMHLALAANAGGEAFGAETFDNADADELIQRVIAEMDETVEALVKLTDPDQVERLHKELGQKMSGAWSLVGTSRIRVHGDYHLGQTLRTVNDDFCLIDFEGEPSRPVAQRRVKQTALKDVAGMVRSLDYATATVMAEVSDQSQMPLLKAWNERAASEFVAIYRATLGTDQQCLIPKDEEAFRAAYDLMLAEKALYELRYELNNRPGWVWIPLNALKALVIDSGIRGTA